MPKPIILRVAKPSDAEALIRVHFAAVHAIPPGLYSAEVKAAWSRLPDEARFQWMRELIIAGKEMILVAEDDSEALGFGVVSPNSCELRALYVHPAVGRRGIGQKLLRELESRCIARGLLSLHLNASLNAEPFYHRHGYRSLSHGTFALTADHHMACVKMEKDLQSLSVQAAEL